jgi:hypothetical protein
VTDPAELAKPTERWWVTDDRLWTFVALLRFTWTPTVVSA